MEPRPSRQSAAARRIARLDSENNSQFADPKREWRRVFAEFWGTFLLVVASAGGMLAIEVYPDKVSPAMGLAAPGIATMAVIYMLGDVSGAHINPEVTLAFALRGHFPWARAPGYIAAQFAGAIAAALLMRLVFGPVGDLGGNRPGPGVAPPLAALVEAVLTAGLVVTILGSASGARNVGPNAALAVGGYNVLARYWAWPLTGASMNSARSFGPDLVSGHLDQIWVYVAGPVAGAVAAVGIEWLLKGPPSDAGSRAAQGES